MPCHTHLRDNPTNLEWKHKLEIAGVLEQRVPEGILQKVNHIKKFPMVPVRFQIRAQTTCWSSFVNSNATLLFLSNYLHS
jgi:hypothetical protein